MWLPDLIDDIGIYEAIPESFDDLTEKSVGFDIALLCLLFDVIFGISLFFIIAFNGLPLGVPLDECLFDIFVSLLSDSFREFDLRPLELFLWVDSVAPNLGDTLSS